MHHPFCPRSCPSPRPRLSRQSLLQALTVLLISLAVSGSSMASEAAKASVAESTATGSLSTATFAMYCYWTGEATLGRVDGVVASRIGHWAGREIVQVDYDPQRTDMHALVAALKKQRSFDAVVLTKPGGETIQRMDPRDVVWAQGEPELIAPKHSLRTRHPKIYALDLDEQQAIALNSWSYFGGPMPDVLTDAQIEQLQR